MIRFAALLGQFNLLRRRQLSLQRRLSLKIILAVGHDNEVLSPANFWNQWLQFRLAGACRVEFMHIPDVSNGAKEASLRKKVNNLSPAISPETHTPVA